jgi:hypothetical protein
MDQESGVFQGVVEEFGESNNGKAKIKVGGQWFYLGGTKMDGVASGDEINFEWKLFKPTGMKYGIKTIDSWGMVKRAEARSSAGHRPPPQAPAPSSPQPQHPAPQERSSLEPEQWRLISNFMAAISSKIDKPAHVAEWYRAIHSAVCGAEFFEEEIPF